MNGETAMNDMSYETHKSTPREDKLSFVLIFAPCFVLLLSVALLGQMVGLHWQEWLPGAEHKTNLFAGVHAAVFTLMSQLI
jgi:light-harvesting complex 1 beta chain